MKPKKEPYMKKLYALRDKETGELRHMPRIGGYAAPLAGISWAYPHRFPSGSELVTLRVEPVEYCTGCIHDGKYEQEVKEDLPSPCTRCRRRVSDNYTPKYEEVTDETVCD